MKRTPAIITALGVTLLAAAGIATLHRADAEGATARKKPANLTESGAILLRGKPFFPIGIYHVRHTEQEYAMLEANGFNAIQGHFTTNVTQFIGTLDMAMRHHIAVSVPLHAQNLVRENLAQSLLKIRAAAHHPAVMSWKICDEPDSIRYARLGREVPEADRAIRNLKPGQPVELTLCQDATMADWMPFCDMVEIDRYPVPKRPLTDVLEFTERTRTHMQPWQNLTFAVQCGWTQDLKTQPTFDQARSMVYLALIGGAKGIFWYSRSEEDGWDLTATPLWPRLKEINAEITSLSMPVMMGAEVNGVRCSTASVQFAAKQYSGKVWLLLTNPTAYAAEAVLTLPPEIHARAARLAATSEPLRIEASSVRVPLRATDSATVIFDL